MMGTTERDYKLGSLGTDFIQEIIKTRAFNSKKEEEWPGELVGMVGEVAKRCAGSPLAATALGSLLGTKSSKQEWDAVLNTSTIRDEENGILPVLKLSYNCLPSYMRQCFAFCAMFPKDYEIDVQMLIHLWMANGFIPEQSKQCPETFGERIFDELKSRSFFQDLKNVPLILREWYKEDDSADSCHPRITCKIHDLMHDVAQSAMGEECAAITTHSSDSEDFIHSARHLYLSVSKPENLLNASLENGSPAFQTLICDRDIEEDMKILSKYNSIRALKIRQGSFMIRPKYLHHLRYLDLSGSGIKAFPEDISILYHLQTLNLSGCDKLEQLPKQLKYLTGLRHLYTHGCWMLKGIPAEIGHLTSLQTLTNFVAGTNSDCCNVRELQNLYLGGKLELSQLENVTGEDAEAACLGNKRKLTELELRWRDCEQEAHNNNHKAVLEGLKPHDGLKLLRIYCCGSSTFPTWVTTLRGMVELVIYDCKELEKLPALWELPALQILRLRKLKSLNCLCSGGTTPVTFPKLKVLILFGMAKFEAWWETHKVQGEEPIFPKVEELEIKLCTSLTALPKAVSMISGVDTIKCHSAFPALRKMTLEKLTMFERWEAGEGISGEEVTFPRLEELSISDCGRLCALPKGSLLVIQSCGGAETVCRRSALPALRKLGLYRLSTLERWGAAERTPGEEVTFPLLESLSIVNCPRLTDLPEAPNLSELDIHGGQQQISLEAAGRCIPSLSRLILDVSPGDTEKTLLHVKKKWNGTLALQAVRLTSCNLFFSSHSSALALWAYFAQLVDLEIQDCNALVYWPENVFQVLVCLRNLVISRCSNLTGRTQASDELSAPALERGGLLPCLESLDISKCKSLVQVPNLPASLKTLRMGGWSDNIESIVFGQQGDTRLVSGEGVVQPDTSSLISGSTNSEATASTAVLKPSSAANHCFLPFPCLETLNIESCGGLSEVVNLPPSIKTLGIRYCNNLQSLSGQLNAVQKFNIDYSSRLESLPCLGDRSLEELKLSFCRSLAPLLDGPQAYSSLRVLWIKDCDGIKSLPPSLQSRLDCLESKFLDARYEEPKTQKRDIRSLVCLK